jgi:chromosome segregation ATPase
LKNQRKELEKQQEAIWGYKGEIKQLQKENDELKQQNADWETSFDICKHYKEAYGTEIVKIKQTIKDMMENERTELGRSVLRQLWEAIQ